MSVDVHDPLACEFCHTEGYAAEYRAMRDERDHWIRLFNRLEATVSHHKSATGEFATDADEALCAARDRILKDAAKTDTG